MRSTTLHHMTLAALLTLCVWATTGCGLVHDSALSLSTIQLPPGKLYSSEFYATATPEDVRKAIGDRSLAGESYTERSMREHSSGFLGTGFTRTLGIFIPNTYLNETTITPLDVALDSTNNLEIIEILLKAGATRGEYALYSYGASRELTALLLRYASPLQLCESMHDFAFNYQKDWLDYCFANIPAASPNCITAYNGMTPFMYASMQEKPEMVTYFLEKGADIEKASQQGNRPLYLALYHGRVATANILLDRGADCTRSGDGGKNLLHLAVMQGKIRDEALLKRLAANVPLSSIMEEQAVQAACYSGKVSVLSTLLARGAVLDPNAAYTVDGAAPDKDKMLAYLKGKGIKAAVGEKEDSI